MFGLMKIATHKAEMQRVRNALGYSDYRYVSTESIAQRVKNERDEAKSRETMAKAEIVTLKARIAELEKPVPLPKRKPVGKALPVTEKAKVPVNGKVK